MTRFYLHLHRAHEADHALDWLHWIAPHSLGHVVYGAFAAFAVAGLSGCARHHIHFRWITTDRAANFTVIAAGVSCATCWIAVLFFGVPA